MNALSLALVLSGVLLNALAQTLLKLGTNRLGAIEFTLVNGPAIALKTLTMWPFLTGFACYGVSLIVWVAALSRLPVTVAYPMLSIGYVINALIARWWLDEHLGSSGWLGIAMICTGVWLIARQA